MMESIITTMPMMVSAILSVLLLVDLSVHGDRPKLNLLLYTLTTTLLYVGHYVYFNRMIPMIPMWDSIYCFCNPAVFPLYFIYIEELTVTRPSRSRQLLYLLPALTCFLLVAGLYAMMDDYETALFIHSYLYDGHYDTLTGLALWQGRAHMLVKIVFALEILPVLYFGWQHITRYNTLVENYYADTEEKVIPYVKTLLVLFVVVSFLAFASNALGRSRFTESVWLLAIPSVSFSLLILLIGYVGLRQNFSIRNIEEEEEEFAELPEYSIKDILKLKDEIYQLVEKEKLYLCPNLKTEYLAQKLNTNRSYVYQAINVEMGMSFSEYINQKRIEKALQLMEQQPSMRIQDIAEKSGYSSVSTFYRNFKQYMGHTPSNYQKRQLAAKQHQQKNNGNGL